MILCENKLTPSEVISEKLKEDITQMELEPGSKLQPIRVLVNKYDTSYLTMRKAIHYLCDEGLLVSKRGSGIYISNLTNQADDEFDEKRQKTIAMVFCGLDRSAIGSLYTKLLHSVEDEARRLGFDVVISFLRSVENFRNTTVYNSSDAFVLIGNDELDGVRELFDDKKFIWVMGSSRSWCDSVTYDNKMIGRVVAEEFVKKGHKNLAYVNIDSVVGSERCTTFRIYAKELGANVVAFEDFDVMTNGRFKTEIDQQAINEWAKRIANSNPKITGVFVIDVASLMFHNALIENGLKPGKDIELACCNWQDYAMGVSYQPTNLELHPESVGSVAVRQLVWRLRNPNENYVSIKIEPSIK